MKYSITILRSARKRLETLPLDVYEQLRDSIRELGENPRPRGCLKLPGRDGWRIRIRDYGVIYEIDDHVARITILNIDPRKNIYR